MVFFIDSTHKDPKTSYYMLGKNIYQHHKQQPFKSDTDPDHFRDVFCETSAVLENFQHFYHSGSSNYLIEFGNSCHPDELRKSQIVKD
jgi:hypothetical protein